MTPALPVPGKGSASPSEFACASQGHFSAAPSRQPRRPFHEPRIAPSICNRDDVSQQRSHCACHASCAFRASSARTAQDPSAPRIRTTHLSCHSLPDRRADRHAGCLLPIDPQKLTSPADTASFRAASERAASRLVTPDRHVSPWLGFSLYRCRGKTTHSLRKEMRKVQGHEHEVHR